MGLLVVGSVAFDTVKTPFGEADEVLGGSATYFSTAASYFTEVSLVAVVGEDFGVAAILVQNPRQTHSRVEGESEGADRRRGFEGQDLHDASQRSRSMWRSRAAGPSTVRSRASLSRSG